MAKSVDVTGESRGKALPAAAGLLSLLVMGASANALPAAIMRAASDFQMAPASLAQAVSVQFAAFLLAAIAGGILADVVGKKVVLQGAGLRGVRAAGPGRRDFGEHGVIRAFGPVS